MRDGFDLGGLGEHVEGRDRSDDETRLQFRDIASERRRVACLSHPGDAGVFAR